MKRNRQLLEKNPIYSLTICKDFGLISCIIIKKFNVKTYSDRIEGEDVKQLMLHFSYPHFLTKNTSINATIKIQTKIHEKSINFFSCNTEIFLDKIRKFKEIERGNIVYFGNKNKIFRLLSSIPIMENHRSHIINNLKPRFYVMNESYGRIYTPWAWKNVRWHVMKELN